MILIAVGGNDRVTAKGSAVAVMATITIPVDVNAMNEDSSIRLATRGSIEALDEQGIKLREGMEALVEDSELWARARGCLRHEIWSAEIIGNVHSVERQRPSTQSTSHATFSFFLVMEK